MEEWVFGTTIGDLKGLSKGSIPPFPTKNQGVFGFRVSATQRPLSSSFWGLPCRILNINYQKELLRGLWVMGLRVKCKEQRN